MKKLIVLLIILFPALAFPATYYVTPGGAGGQTGADWANAFALTDFETYAEGTPSAGDLFYFKGGVTYTLASSISVDADGTTTSLIRVVGVVGESTTPATGTDRPTIAASTYLFQFDNYWSLENLIGTTESSSGFETDIGGRFINCKVTNSSGSADRPAIYNGGASGITINCEAISTNGPAFSILLNSRLIYSYAHDSNVGVYSGSDANVIEFNVIDTCVTGIDTNAQDNLYINQNTIYNSTTAIASTTSTELIAMNNIITDSTTGISATADLSSSYFDYNNYYNNTGDVSNVTKGSNATANNPNFTNAAGGDFSLQAGSSCLDAAQMLTLGIQ